MTSFTSRPYREAVAELNADQLTALNENGNTVLLAGPGSGKTATLVLKVARLLERIPAPRGVACLTYGNEAAREFQRRLLMLGVQRAARLYMGTVHSFCLSQILRPFATRLPTSLRHLAHCEIASAAETASARQKGLRHARVNDNELWWRSKIEEFRRVAQIDNARLHEFDNRLPAIVAGYTQELRRVGRIDFDDIVNGALTLVEKDEYVRRAIEAKYPWLVVDEYQDLGLALHRIVVTLMDDSGVRFFVVGDPDQSIYGFSGARPEYLHSIANRKDVTPIKLQLNYRCKQNIIDASLHVLQAEDERPFRSAPESREKGEVFFYPCAEGLWQQASVVGARIQRLMYEGVAPGEIGILGKRWADLQGLETELASRSIPYRMDKSRGYKSTPLTSWIEDMVRWCVGGIARNKPRLVDIFLVWENLSSYRGERDSTETDLSARVVLYKILSSLRYHEMPIGEWIRALDSALGLSKLCQRSMHFPLRMRHDIAELQCLLDALVSPQVASQPIVEFSGVAKDKVVLQSLHGSKGLEYAVVFMISLEKGLLPAKKDDLREARRLFYVGMTRARREVHLLWSGFYTDSTGVPRIDGPSPLIDELKRRLSVPA